MSELFHYFILNATTVCVQGEDPWSAAQQFIHRNDLSQQFLETVANFIVTNSRDSEPALPVTGPVDPFTGLCRTLC